MEVVEDSISKASGIAKIRRENSENERVRVKRKTLQSVLEECQRALQLLNTTSGEYDEEDDDGEFEANVADEGRRIEGPPSMHGDRETDELCDLLKSRFDCPAFLERLECAQASASQNIAEEGNSWDMVSDKDLWEGEETDTDQEDYVLVGQEDIVEGIARFMADYLLSLKQTKDLTPIQLQEALSKTFSVKRKKGKLKKAWDGSIVIYNIASWGATAIGIYQNPAILRAATKAFWTSCHVISKVL